MNYLHINQINVINYSNVIMDKKKIVKSSLGHHKMLKFVKTASLQISQKKYFPLNHVENIKTQHSSTP